MSLLGPRPSSAGRECSVSDTAEATDTGDVMADETSGPLAVNCLFFHWEPWFSIC